MGTGEVQGPLWGAAADDWAELAEPVQVPFYEAALAALDVAAGCNLLDVGCGAGLALMLARKRGAAVSGIDAADGLLRVARGHLPDADLRLGDIEELPFPDDACDAVTAFNSVQYAADPTAALGEIKRVARPGAGVAVVTWGTADQCEMRVVLGAIGQLLPPPPPGAGGPFALAAAGALEGLVAAAGLEVDRAFDVPTPYAWPDLDTATRSQMASGPARRAIEEAGVEAATDAVRDALESGLQADGSILLDNVFKVVVAHT